MTQGRGLLFIVRFFILVLALIAVGCGGDAPSSESSPPPVVNNPPGPDPEPDPDPDPDPANIIVSADPGLIVAVRVGEVAILDGSGSSASTSDPLNFTWSFSSRPNGSNAVLLNSTASFTDSVAPKRNLILSQSL